MKALNDFIDAIKRRLRRQTEERLNKLDSRLAREAVTHVCFSDETDENGNTYPIICINGVKVLKVCTDNSVIEGTVNITDAGKVIAVLRKNWVNAYKLIKV